MLIRCSDYGGTSLDCEALWVYFENLIVEWNIALLLRLGCRKCIPQAQNTRLSQNFIVFNWLVAERRLISNRNNSITRSWDGRKLGIILYVSYFSARRSWGDLRVNRKAWNFRWRIWIFNSQIIQVEFRSYNWEN